MNKFTARVFILTTLSMFAFAANSILCRVALHTTDIDPISFTNIRLVSGAMFLLVVLSIDKQSNLKNASNKWNGSWKSSLALLAYAWGFSLAYQGLSTGTGALLLFGAVQITMIGYGLLSGERFSSLQWCGLALAVLGLGALLCPNTDSPPIVDAILMTGAGLAWGIYSLFGRGSIDPTGDTGGNFIRAAILSLCLGLFYWGDYSLNEKGVFLAVTSGALASGLGYAIWYRALPLLKASVASTVQLSVPVIAAIAGIVILSEPLSLHLAVTSAAILGGISLVLINSEKI